MALADRIRTVLNQMDGPEYGRQARLAEIAQCGRPVVNHWLSQAQKNINSKHALAISAALGYRVEWLMEGRGPAREVLGEARPVAQEQEAQNVGSSPKANPDLFLTHVTVEEMHLLTFCRTYPEAGKRLREMAIDLTGHPAMK